MIFELSQSDFECIEKEVKRLKYKKVLRIIFPLLGLALVIFSFVIINVFKINDSYIQIPYYSIFSTPGIILLWYGSWIMRETKRDKVLKNLIESTPRPESSL